MNRLHEITYDTSIWEIVGNSNTGYLFLNTVSKQIYPLLRNIVGIEQIKGSLDSFLMYSKLSNNERRISKVQLSSGMFIEQYSHRFRTFDFISEDIILFDKDSSFSATLYSISLNKEIRNLNFINVLNIGDTDSQECKSRTIELLYDNSHFDYPSCLKVDYELISLHTMEFIQILVDPIILVPFPTVYSTLRNNFIKLDDTFTLRHLIHEDNYYLKIIDNYLHNLYFSDSRKSGNELCLNNQ